MIRFDTDRLREILDTLSRNKSRTFLTGFGVFWGVFMLVGLIGGGDGLKELINRTSTDSPQTLPSYGRSRPLYPTTDSAKDDSG